MKVAIAFVAEYLFVAVVVLELLYLAVYRRTRWKELLTALIAFGSVWAWTNRKRGIQGPGTQV